eukprot:CAMPEP_0204286522 /NCGR_PEP_ID=MMETSP0468-20130131/52903_1 /ASSEMBLY_ACC=CAM_ASM_000383 /TAXON_ID=2969 /ORGANISM="Oxyrrhis marina" /LENGTH=154 /DNA_ID=CAMNT_0051264437 /DNA_START=200 /DNA_END=664 /DNA_ORIENTATION=+
MGAHHHHIQVTRHILPSTSLRLYLSSPKPIGGCGTTGPQGDHLHFPLVLRIVQGVLNLGDEVALLALKGQVHPVEICELCIVAVTGQALPPKQGVVGVIGSAVGHDLVPQVSFDLPEGVFQAGSLAPLGLGMQGPHGCLERFRVNFPCLLAGPH